MRSASWRSCGQGRAAKRRANAKGITLALHLFFCRSNAVTGGRRACGVLRATPEKRDAEGVWGAHWATQKRPKIDRKSLLGCFGRPRAFRRHSKTSPGRPWSSPGALRNHPKTLRERTRGAPKVHRSEFFEARRAQPFARGVRRVFSAIFASRAG